MGQHYVPQFYLNGFSTGRGKTIWVFDKQERRRFCTQIKSAANETQFYSPGTERYLAQMVEAPANDVLKNICARAPITAADKRVLAEYIAAFIKRVPSGREMVRQLAPRVAARLRDRYTSELAALVSEDRSKASAAERLRARIEQVLFKYGENPPKEVWLSTIPPDRSPGMVAVIAAMSWHFLTCKKPAFITSDNPVFYFTKWGIARPQSEISFPVSTYIALWATWAAGQQTLYSPADDLVVTQVNRRTASRATRYAFHCCDDEGILRLLLKRRWDVHRLPLVKEGFP